jgi:hypothetical protein
MRKHAGRDIGSTGMARELSVSGSRRFTRWISTNDLNAGKNASDVLSLGFRRLAIMAVSRFALRG